MNQTTEPAGTGSEDLGGQSVTTFLSLIHIQKVGTESMSFLQSCEKLRRKLKVLN